MSFERHDVNRGAVHGVALSLSMYSSTVRAPYWTLPGHEAPSPVVVRLVSQRHKLQSVTGEVSHPAPGNSCRWLAQGAEQQAYSPLPFGQLAWGHVL